jgi:hypothetical protein
MRTVRLESWTQPPRRNGAETDCAVERIDARSSSVLTRAGVGFGAALLFALVVLHASGRGRLGCEVAADRPLDVARLSVLKIHPRRLVC